MSYCASCPEIAAKTRAISNPHNQYYWSTVIVFTLFEIIITVINVVRYARYLNNLTAVVINTVITILFDLASLKVAFDIFMVLSQSDHNTLPKPMQCMIHFFLSFVSEWLRFYVSACLLAECTNGYPKLLIIQAFVGPTMSFFTLRQMLFNALLWVNNSDCQYVLNTLFTHLAVISIFLYVIISLLIVVLAEDWNEGETMNAVVLGGISSACQIGVLLIVSVQHLFCPKASRKSSRSSASKVAVMPKSESPTKTSKVKFSITKRLSQHGSMNSKRKNKKKKFLQCSSMMSLEETEKTEEETFDIEPLNEHTLKKTICETINNVGDDDGWLDILTIEVTLKLKLHFYSWSEYGFADSKQFFLKFRNTFEMKYASKDTGKRQLMVRIRKDKESVGL